jgi:hypothetical protein
MDVFVLCSHLYDTKTFCHFRLRKQYADYNGYRDILNRYYNGGKHIITCL